MSIDPEIRLAIKEEINDMSFSEKQIQSIEHAVVNVMHKELQPVLAIQERHSTILAMVGATLIVMIPIVVSIYFQGKV